jgi:hypothetical protein
MSALFNNQSPTLGRLLESDPDAAAASRCVLAFHERSRSYRLPCDVELLGRDDALFQATYWHNALFNPDLPPDIAIVSFVSDWVHASRSRET